MRRQLDMPALGQRLKALRTSHGLSMRELAARSDVSFSLVSRIESGKVVPTLDSLYKLLASMEVELWEFLADAPTSDPADRVVYKKADMVVSEDAEHSFCIAFPKDPRIGAQLSYDVYYPHTRPMEKVIHKSDILGIVISGELTLDVEGRGVFRVTAGDAFYIRAGVAHSPMNDGNKPVKLVGVQLPQLQKKD